MAEEIEAEVGADLLDEDVAREGDPTAVVA
jgi:hypothetical protein